MWTKAFWLDTIERSIKTAAQVAAPLIGATVIWDVDWRLALGITLAAALNSVLTSVGSSLAFAPGNTGNASLISGNEYT